MLARPAGGGVRAAGGRQQVIGLPVRVPGPSLPGGVPGGDHRGERLVAGVGGVDVPCPATVRRAAVRRPS
ncbi:hypothetical protein Shyhy02_43160 [Streptomyces hygroscopicus subsp. hygroscopicus]|nr:hypothetical protein Shyhy02_43160 [Streptomyces hygroscopicus subsp. hygroscopicus]